MRHTRGAGDLNEMCTRGKAEAPGGLDRQFKIILLIGSRWALRMARIFCYLNTSSELCHIEQEIYKSPQQLNQFLIVEFI